MAGRLSRRHRPSKNIRKRWAVIFQCLIMGADGRFLPDFPGLKYVYELSDITPVAVSRGVEDEASLGSYSCIQIAHVLGHVPYPLELTLKASSCLQPGGYLYRAGFRRIWAMMRLRISEPESASNP